MLGQKTLKKLNFRRLRRLCKSVEKTGSVYLSGEALGIPRSSLQDLLTSAKELLDAGVIIDKEAKQAMTVFKVISVSHARWALKTLNNIQYGGLADARRSNATLYLLQTFKPLDFPKTSVVSGSENALQLIATLRAIGSAGQSITGVDALEAPKPQEIQEI